MVSEHISGASYVQFNNFSISLLTGKLKNKYFSILSHIYGLENVSCKYVFSHLVAITNSSIYIF
jgi:hypothetical protein